jgi:hypothetical protein
LSHDALHFLSGVRDDESVAVVTGGALAQPGEGRLKFVVARRLEKWPHDESRSEGARMLAEGASLAEVLRRYPEAVPNVYRGKPVEPARRVIYAHYALLQELQGEPDIDPADGATVEKVIRDQASSGRVYAQAAL